MATPRPQTGKFQRQRRRSEKIDLDAEAPFIPWSEMFTYLRREFRQGDHVAIIGPTGTGKTHMALEIAELRTYVLVVACKPRDPLIEEAQSRGYHLVPGNDLTVEYAESANGQMKPLHNRIIYWPRLHPSQYEKMPRHQLLGSEKRLQKPLVGGAIGYVRLKGHWALVLDEGTWVCRDLNLQRDVDSALFQFRTLRSSVIVLGQRPSWMGRYVLSMPTHLFLFQTSDANDAKALGEITGVNTWTVREIVPQLDHQRHECLYVNSRTREMYRTIAPPR